MVIIIINLLLLLLLLILLSLLIFSRPCHAQNKLLTKADVSYKISLFYMIH